MLRVGFWSADVKPFGPVHEYVAPATVGVLSWIVAPAQYGPPFVAVGVAGAPLIGTLIAFAAWQPFELVIVRVSVTLPEAPAVYVTVCEVAPEVIDPLEIAQE